MTRTRGALLLVLVLATGSVRADDRSTRSVDKANAGLEAYGQGRWDDALRLFREAEALYHSPVYLLYEARTLGRAGRWREAKQHYDRLLAEALPADAPAAFRDARREAQVEYERIDREIPALVVVVKGGSAKTRITVAGLDAKAGRAIELDPGTYEVRARDGNRVARGNVRMVAGRKVTSLELTFPTTAKPEAEKHWNRTGLVFGGVGAGLALVGGAVGLVALSQAADARDALPESCNGKTCPASRRGAVEDETRSARTLGTLSTGLFIGAGVAFATGVVLVLTDSDVSSRTSAGVPSAAWRF
ncbi:MAG: tetratricopeptide repeat protein [Polyangiaceae bacterium]